jgi:hypothetical protein
MLRGLWSRTNGVQSTKALKFEKPRIGATAAGRGPTLLMGKVETKSSKRQTLEGLMLEILHPMLSRFLWLI